MNNAEVNTKTPRCRYISKIGARCHADVEAGKSYCFFHDPEQKNKQAQVRQVRKEAPSRETDNVVMPPGLPVLTLETPSDITRLLAETVNQFRRREIDLRAAKALCNMACLLLRSLKETTLLEQLAAARTMSYYSQLCKSDQPEDQQEALQDQSTVSLEPAASAQDSKRHGQQSWSQDLRS